jgi:hypothetical protein
MHFKKLPGFAVALSVLVTASAPAWAILTINTGQYINDDIGATTFYANGFTGTSAIIANIEGGYIWNQQILTSQDTVEFSDPSITGQVDLHATAVGSVLNGNVPFDGFLILNNTLYPVSVLDGIAPNAQVWSGAIATQWFDVGGGQYSTSFDISNASFSTPYVEAMVTGVPQAGGQTADVITSSWDTSASPDGNNFISVTLDALANKGGKTLVIAAGNAGPGSNTVNAPASGTNAIVVGALQSDSTTPAFSQIADFSSVSPTDFFVPADPDGNTGTELSGVRARIDITAPGTDMILAYYGGNTGGGAFGSGTPNPDTGLIAYPFAGTSFAAPIVASGAGLVVDAGKTLFPNDPRAIDGRVVKAVLMNSATKPQGWNNGQTNTSYGAILTTQSVDYQYGAGILNLNQAWAQFTGGTTDVVNNSGAPTLAGGIVQPTGWTFGQITHQINHRAVVKYQFDESEAAGSMLTTTLDWYSDEITKNGPAGLDATYGSFDNLDLSVYLVSATQHTLIAQSASLYNSVEQLYFALPSTGVYEIDVTENNYLWNFVGDTSTYFGLAWNVDPVQAPANSAVIGPISVTLPEPASAALLAAGFGMLVRPRRRGKTTA